MAQQPLSPTPIERLRSDLTLEQAVHVRGGLSVYSLDSQLLGWVQEFIINNAGNLTSFIIDTGSPTQPTLLAPMAWIQSTTSEQIQLRVNASDVLRSAPAARRAASAA